MLSVIVTLALFLDVTACHAQILDQSSAHSIVTQAELKTVKLYGAGGFAGLDAYQSGFFISGEGHILTVWSTVLDVDEVLVVCSDGSRYAAEVVGVDPNLEIAVLKTDKAPNHFFDLKQTTSATPGTRVLALSNLFGIATGIERSSVQKGVVMAITDLKAGRGFSESVYKGKVYVIDAMTNNPGAAGGALTNLGGQLVGLLGKELRDKRADIWLNYAIPLEAIMPSVEKLVNGQSIQRQDETREVASKPVTLSKLESFSYPTC